jgi:hypothetical protein
MCKVLPCLLAMPDQAVMRWRVVMVFCPRIGRCVTTGLPVGFARGGTTGRGTSGALGARLSKALHGKKFGGGGLLGSSARALVSDLRQRVVVKVSFRKHAAGGGSGGGKLLAHASYLERDGAAREGEQGRFYDRTEDEVEGARDLVDVELAVTGPIHKLWS